MYIGLRRKWYVFWLFDILFFLLSVKKEKMKKYAKLKDKDFGDKKTEHIKILIALSTTNNQGLKTI